MVRDLTVITFLFIFSLAGYSKPKISFFIELKGTELQKLFADSALIPELIKMNSTLRIGLIDFSPECTGTITKLNKAGIPVIAWLLLPEEEGYWFNMNNGEKAAKRYEDFKLWTALNNLKWKGIGIDLELDFNDAKMIVRHPLKLAWKAYKRLYDNHSLEAGSAIYKMLTYKIQSDGYYLESYVIPMIYDERIAGTTSFQKLLGLIDIQTPNEIPMLYTSAMGNASIIPSYHQEGQPIALGITGGGVVIEGVQPKFYKLEELQRDLLISNQYTNEVIIFCLEASRSNGWLQEIQSVDYTQTQPDLTSQLTQQVKTRKTIRHLLVILDHPLLMTLGIVLFIAGLFYALVKLIKLIFSKAFQKPPG
jgi:hypothetical protein